MTRPTIGILGYLEENKESVFPFRQNMTGEGYTRALSSAGALSLVIPYTENEDDIEELVSKVDGILVPGGADVDPHLYKAEPNGYSRDYDITQDRFQISAIKAALSQDKPIFGICRGHQILNASLGGILTEDIDKEEKTYVLHKDVDRVQEDSHEVQLDETSFLFTLSGKKSIMVNSLHHQAVQTPAAGMTVAARALDGIIEATEDRKRKLISVQWHPEALIDNKEEGKISLDIFRYFVSLCRK